MACRLVRHKHRDTDHDLGWWITGPVRVIHGWRVHGGGAASWSHHGLCRSDFAPKYEQPVTKFPYPTFKYAGRSMMSAVRVWFNVVLHLSACGCAVCWTCLAFVSTRAVKCFSCASTDRSPRASWRAARAHVRPVVVLQPPAAPLAFIVCAAMLITPGYSFLLAIPFSSGATIWHWGWM